MNSRSALGPVFICLPHIGVRLHLRQNLICNSAHLCRVGPHYTESNRPWRIGTKHKSNCTNTSLRSESCCDLVPKTIDELVSLLRVGRQNDHLRKIWIRQFGIVGQPEMGAAATYIRA